VGVEEGEDRQLGREKDWSWHRWPDRMPCKRDGGQPNEGRGVTKERSRKKGNSF